MTNFKAMSKGFTLVELLVAIAIIALLTSVGLVSFSRAQQNSRDARRKADLQSLKAALEMYYDSNNAYPSGGYAVISTRLATLVSGGHIKALPTDPVSTRYYYYTSLSSNQCYCLSSEMEITTNASSAECTRYSGHASSYAYTTSCP